MAVHPHAGKLPAPETLENIPALVSAYYTEAAVLSGPESPPPLCGPPPLSQGGAAVTHHQAPLLKGAGTAQP